MNEDFEMVSLLPSAHMYSLLFKFLFEITIMWFDVCSDAWRYVVDEETDKVRPHPGEYRGVVYNSNRLK